MILSIDTAIDGVNDAIASSAAGMLEKGGGEEALALGVEDDLNGVVPCLPSSRVRSTVCRGDGERCGQRW